MAKSKDRDRDKDRNPKKRSRRKEERSPSSERHKKRSKKDGSRKESKDKDSRRKSSSSSSKDKERDSRKKSSSSKDKKRKKDRKEEGGKGEREDHGVQAEIQISEKDYFTRATEFKVWLCHKKKKFFEDLTSVESHELFEKFVKDWNRGKLDPHFYEGRLPEELVARSRKTQHKWGFVNRLTDRDQMQLELANDSVHSSTEKVKGVASNVPVLPTGSAPAAPAGSGGGKQRQADSRGGGGGGGGSWDGAGGGGGADSRTEAKRKRRQEREKHAVVLDEIAPKETGRQATADKRREVGARTHAAAKAREDAADGLDMREADTMGGGDSFHETLARAKHGKQRRQTAKTEHLQELAAKEAEKRAAFMAQMGLKAGQKITIQPRRDG